MNVERASREGIIVGIAVTPANGQALCAAVEQLRAHHQLAGDEVLLEMVLMAGVSFLQLRAAEAVGKRETLFWNSPNNGQRPDDSERILLQIEDVAGVDEVRVGFLEAGEWYVDYGLGRRAHLPRNIVKGWSAWPEGVAANEADVTNNHQSFLL
jgi:hypothetical protein